MQQSRDDRISPKGVWDSDSQMIVENELDKNVSIMKMSIKNDMKSVYYII